MTKTTVVPLNSESEAEMIAQIMSDRECEETIAGNLVYITTEIKELEYV
jgi:hypothetical protein